MLVELTLWTRRTGAFARTQTHSSRDAAVANRQSLQIRGICPVFLVSRFPGLTRLFEMLQQPLPLFVDNAEVELLV